jgi:beta-phosphoglucomutase
VADEPGRDLLNAGPGCGTCPAVAQPRALPLVVDAPPSGLLEGDQDPVPRKPLPLEKHPLIDTIIFDAEGVVIDTEPIWDRGQEEFLRRRGCAYDRASTKHLLTGRSLAEGVRILQEQYDFPGDPALLAEERAEIVRDLFGRGVPFVPGFREFFERSRYTYGTCMATAMVPDLLDAVDQGVGLSRLFGGRLFTIADVRYRSKPEPDLFLHAARQLGSEPAACVVIEDAPKGVEAAKRAGMKCIALTTTFVREKLTAADQVVDCYAEIDLEAL